MEKKIRVTRKDYADYNSYFIFKKRRRFLIVTILILSLAISLTSLVYSDVTLFGFLKTFIFCLIPVAICYPLFMSGFVYFTQYLPSEKGGSIGVKTFRIADEGLVEESESNKTIGLPI